ncbi:hypothetical protein EX30DRAFT_368143 [Ascodesmis nigricans]|uniref:Type 1 phosphatases regulator n=1 Tax=Ascodesmis nigricans TaxID=341454 RepID=A0A4S2N7B5_9PEZI|nr:hypothetical protein EX30DRAFT_368143 [Ascodesmis nigricans]
MRSPAPGAPQQQQQAPPAATTTTTTTAQVVLPESVAPDGTLRLRGAAIEDRRVKWDEGVVDNEGMGKKSSKVCCIYHRPRAYDESSDSDSSDSSSDDDSDRGNGGGGDGDGCEKSDRCGHGHGKKSRKPKPNAYEKMPKHKKGSGGHGLQK